MTLSELIERVEKLDGPDREVDESIYEVATIILSQGHPEAVLRDADYVSVAIRTDGWPWIPTLDDPDPPSWHGVGFAPVFTASLDAAIALTERVLPGWSWRAGRTSLFPKGWAYVSRTHPSHCDRKDEASSSDGKAASPAIALLLATLRALSAQERDDGR